MTTWQRLKDRLTETRHGKPTNEVTNEELSYLLTCAKFALDFAESEGDEDAFFAAERLFAEEVSGE
jgi:hypothetical protein